jgi:hypothetical protein
MELCAHCSRLQKGLDTIIGVNLGTMALWLSLNRMSWSFLSMPPMEIISLIKRMMLDVKLIRDGQVLF